MKGTHNAKDGFLEIDINFIGRRIFVGPAGEGKQLCFDFLGKQFIAQLPNFRKDEDDELESTYQGTHIVRSWLNSRNELDLMYGQPNIETATGKLMCFHINRLIVRTVEPIKQSEAKNLAHGLLEWRDLFIAWLEAALFSNLENNDHGLRHEEEFDAFFIPTGTGADHIVVTEFPGEIYHLPHGHLIHELNFLQTAATKAANKDLPPLYRSQLVSALKHYDREEYRECLLDTATAVEVTLTELLDQALENLTTDQKALLRDKYRGVSQLQAALKKLKIDTPKELQDKVGTPRNLAMHKGAAINEETAKEALFTAKDFIFKRMPLNDK